MSLFPSGCFGAIIVPFGWRGFIILQLLVQLKFLTELRWRFHRCLHPPYPPCLTGVFLNRFAPTQHDPFLPCDGGCDQVVGEEPPAWVLG